MNYRRALSLRPQFFEAHINLARVLCGKRRFEDVADHYSRALEIEPQNASLHVQIGEALLEAGRQGEALSAAEAAARSQDQTRFPHFALGVLFARCGKPDTARTHFIQYLEQEPGDSEGARQVLAGLGFAPVPERASPAHLQRIYNWRARYWTGNRGYRAHELVADAVARTWTVGPAVILDGGCGTGAAGPLLRPLASRLEGVDFSSAMLGRAREIQAYDALHEAELVDFLSAHPDSYDVIAAAATLIHLGELKPVFAAACGALRDNGLLVFTVFPNPNDPETFGVAPMGGFAEGGCFVHGSGYIRRAAAEAGFSVVLLETAPHEIDPHGAPVMGLVVALCREANPVVQE